jgi:hypothetical protein
LSETTSIPKTTKLYTDAVAPQFEAFTQQFLESSKKIGQVYVDAYVQMGRNIADAQSALAERTDDEIIKRAVTAQSKVTRELTEAYASVARQVLA